MIHILILNSYTNDMSNLYFEFSCLLFAVEYHNENGNFRVPRSLGSLGEWVHHQRKLYNKKDKNFMSKRYARLEEIGFEFKTGRRDVKSWDDRFEQLVRITSPKSVLTWGK